MLKRNWLFVCCIVLMFALSLQPAMAQESSTWHALPASGQGGAYICGNYQMVNTINRDGVLYVSMGLFGAMMNDALPDIDWESGVVQYHYRDLETDTNQSTLTISAKDNVVTITVNGSTVHWKNQPFWQEHDGEDTLPNLMVPLRDVCQTLHMSVQYQDGIVFVGYMRQPLVLPDTETIHSLQAKMDIPVETGSLNSYSLGRNHGQVLVWSDASLPIWQTPNKQEGALLLTNPTSENQKTFVQELQHDGQVKTLYPLPGSEEWNYDWKELTSKETVAGQLLFVHLINTAQSQLSIYYLVQPDGSLRKVLESNHVEEVVLTKDALYYIQGYLFGERSQLLSVSLNDSEQISEELDRADLSYKKIALVDQTHLLVHTWAKAENEPTLYLLDLSNKQYQPITDQNWAEFAVAGQWIYGLHANDQAIYRFHADGSELSCLTGKVRYFGDIVFDETAITYQDEQKCLWVVGDQNIQLTTAPVEQWQAVGDQLYYRQSGAAAGIYVYDHLSSEQKCLLTGEYKDMAVSDQGQVVVLPFVGQSIAVYQDGAWQTIPIVQ